MAHVRMTRLLVWATLFWPFFAVAAPRESPDSDARYCHVLGKNIETLLGEEAIPALEQGYGDYFFDTVAPVIETLNAAKLESLEELAKRMGVDSLQNEFVKALIQRIKQGMEVPDAIRKFDLAEYVTLGITDEIKIQLADIDQMMIMDNDLELPAQGLMTDRLFWDSHVLSNRLENLNRLAVYAQMIATPHIQRYGSLKPKRKTEAQTKRIGKLRTSLRVANDIVGAREKLVLNAAEYRLLDLERAVKKLQTSDQFKERLLAVWTLEDSAKLLLEFLERATPQQLAARPRLAELDLKASVERQHQLGLDYGRDVVDKANLLRLGSFWWLRGRYGAASQAKGLLKDRRAMNSEYLMVGLFMPTSPDKPICDLLPTEERFQGYDRRHFYTWAVEYRKKRARSKSASKSETLASKRDATQVGAGTVFW